MHEVDDPPSMPMVLRRLIHAVVPLRNSGILLASRRDV
jgi:hypothetical protein